MQLEIKIRENGKWRGLTLAEIGNTLGERIANLAEKETVIRYSSDTGECIFTNGKWVEHYKSKDKVVIDLCELVLLLDLHPSIPLALKTFQGAEILMQETLFEEANNGNKN